jgi:hypothetical protein
MSKFGNKGKLSFAVGIADLKSFILQILILLEWNSIDLRKKVFAIIIIVLDIILFIMVIRVYCFPNKKDLKEDGNSIKMNKKENQSNDENDEEADISLKNYSKSTNNWNLAIDVISVIIVVIEATAKGLE